MTIPPAMPGSPAPLALIGPWMMRQRWYANKGAAPVLEEIGNWVIPSDSDVTLVTHLLLDHTVGKPALYQVPIAYHRAPAEGVPIGEANCTLLYDGPHDQAYTRALLRLITHELEVHGDRTWIKGTRALGDVASANTEGMVSRVLTGEQSNTSIIFERPDGDGVPVIVKLFRALHDGDNPDVELQTALAAAGSHAVPAPVGNIVGDWSDRGEPDGRARGHLAFAQEFLPGAVDAWRVALGAAERGEDFSVEARELGIATAGVHATLAATLPTSETTDDDIAATIELMRGRLALAIAEVPSLAPLEQHLSDVFTLASGAGWPLQQRIHGDLHLGQVLSVPGRGWVLVDFEGEPLRPMRERSRLDSPLRDIAGMLRSFDYVAGSLAVGGSAADAAAWVGAARAAFMDGYCAASGRDIRDDQTLIDAFEIDKALYEAVYEVRNRPGWLPIPVQAIERLSVRAAHR